MDTTAHQAEIKRLMAAVAAALDRVTSEFRRPLPQAPAKDSDAGPEDTGSA